jgi:formate dehydrogenase iron-sulfur subunit
VILGLRHSWLSREALAFGIFVKLATLLVAAEILAPNWLAARPVVLRGLLAAVVVSGLCGVSCSVMVYHVVRRPFWRASVSGVKFAGTTLVLGLATALASLGLSKGLASGGTPQLVARVAGAMILVSAAKLAFEARDRRNWDEDDAASEPLRRTARLLRGPLKRSAGLRRFLGVAGGMVLPGLVVVGVVSGDRGVAAATASLMMAATIGGELIERSLFFRAVTRLQIPGGRPS